MNVLFTCAGRRNYLLQYFREALGGQGQVLATDASPVAPAMLEADMAFVVPPVSDPCYFDAIYEIAVQQNVQLMISLNDLELPYLARTKQRFLDAGIIPVVSDPEVIDICFDKQRTAEFLSSVGLAVPKTYFSLDSALQALSKGELSFPLVVKPRWGTASIGIEFPQDAQELELAYKLVSYRLSRTILADVSATDPNHCVMIQERLDGHEYGLDVINDLQGCYATTFAKRKLSMRAGETDRAEVVDAPELFAVGENIAKNLKHIGNLDCDVFFTERGPVVLEMNPRFGGGYPFSQAAGADLPAALIAWASNTTVDQSWLTVAPGTIAVKCDRLVVKQSSIDRCGAGTAACLPPQVSV